MLAQKFVLDDTYTIFKFLISGCKYLGTCLADLLFLWKFSIAWLETFLLLFTELHLSCTMLLKHLNWRVNCNNLFPLVFLNVYNIEMLFNVSFYTGFVLTTFYWTGKLRFFSAAVSLMLYQASLPSITSKAYETYVRFS